MIVLRGGEQGGPLAEAKSATHRPISVPLSAKPAPRVSGVSLAPTSGKHRRQVEARFGDIPFEPSR